jgi:hypothetical protein
MTSQPIPPLYKETGPNWVLFLKSRPKILNPAQRNGFRPHDFGSKTPLGRPRRTTVSTQFGTLSQLPRKDHVRALVA